MDFETICIERADGVATITLHRPDRLNAWTPVMGRERSRRSAPPITIATCAR